MKPKLTFLITCLFFSLNVISETLDKININGLSNISRGTVLSYLPIEVGDPIPDEITIKKLISSMRNTNFFDKVELNVSENQLNISVTENPIIKYFEFKNYKEDEVLNEEIITDIVKNFNLSRGKIFNQNNLNDLIVQLKKIYSDNAYFQTNIRIDIDRDSQNRIGVELNFDEGDQALIGSFKIAGNKTFSQDELLNLFSIGEADFFILNFFTEKDHFSKQQYDSGIEKLKNLYLSSGYLDIAITDQKILFNKEKNLLDITITLSEGDLFKLGNISFTGTLLDQDSKQLRALIPLKNGESFFRDKIISGIKKITRIYQNKGYAYSKVSMDVNSISKDKTIDVNINVIPDDRVYIDRIVISGNTRTQDDVIRRKIKILEGQVYSKEYIENSISNIKRLGYFSNVSYEFKTHQNNKDRADILINVTETKTGEISLGLSHSNSTGAAITAGITQNNILGTGNVLNAKFSNSEAVEVISVYFKNPYINDKGHSMSIGFTDKTVNASDLDTSSYIMNVLGYSVGYGVPLSETSEIFSELTLDNIDLTCGDNLKNTDEVAQCAANDDLDLNLSLSYSSNDLNDYYFPTKGSKSEIVTTFGLPVSDLKYYKVQSSHRQYHEVFNDKTFKFSTRFNFGSGYGGDELPFYERFFEGGSSSVRGFDFNSLGAKYASSNKPKGGEISLVSSVGVASSLKFAGIDNENMRASVFLDGGIISEKISNFDPSELRSSTGLALSWITPVGPIGVHYAIPIIKKANDSTTSFSFALGTTF